MLKPLERCLHEIRRVQHRGGQRFPDRSFQRGNRAQAGVLGGARMQVDVGEPRLAQGIDSGRHHSRQVLDAVELAEIRRRQNRLNRRSQGFVVDRPQQSSGQTRRKLLESDDLQAVPAVVRRIEPKLAHGQTVMDNDGSALDLGHGLLLNPGCRWRVPGDFPEGLDTDPRSVRGGRMVRCGPSNEVVLLRVPVRRSG